MNELLNTNFRWIEILELNMKYDNYNIDIVIVTDLGKYLLEVNGEFWHGLTVLPEDHRYY